MFPSSHAQSDFLQYLALEGQYTSDKPNTGLIGPLPAFFRGPRGDHTTTHERASAGSRQDRVDRFKYGMGGKENIVMDLKSPDNVKIGGDLGGLVSEAWMEESWRVALCLSNTWHSFFFLIY